jgi:enamine deaminase RidA (YjgF/YER057c/UK114 family)
MNLGFRQRRYCEPMQEHLHHSTLTRWEKSVGYDRAVRAGAHVYVSGTLGAGPDGEPAGDAYQQSVAAFERIRLALEAVGSSLADVVRTRMYVVDVAANSDAVGRAHFEYLGEVRPAATMVGVAALIGPGFVVEIEVDALATA